MDRRTFLASLLAAPLADSLVATEDPPGVTLTPAADAPPPALELYFDDLPPLVGADGNALRVHNPYHKDPWTDVYVLDRLTTVRARLLAGPRAVCEEVYRRCSDPTRAGGHTLVVKLHGQTVCTLDHALLIDTGHTAQAPDALHVYAEARHRPGAPGTHLLWLDDSGVTVGAGAADVERVTDGLGSAAGDPVAVRRTLRVDTADVDWEELRAQKCTLNELVDRLLTPNQLSNDERHALDGIRHLLDHVQDQAAEVLGEEAVFGSPTDDETPST